MSPIRHSSLGKLLATLALLCLTVLISAPTGASASGFVEHCDACTMYNGHSRDTNGHLFLCHCGCDGQHHISSIHLNEYISNVDGKFVWGPDRPGHRGGHREDCQAYDLQKGHIYYADCKKLDGAWYHTGIELNNYISCKEGRIVPDF